MLKIKCQHSDYSTYRSTSIIDDNSCESQIQSINLINTNRYIIILNLLRTPINPAIQTTVEIKPPTEPS